MAQDLTYRLEALIRANDWFMSVLQTVRACDPPDWYVGAGVVRNVVWDALHGYDRPTPVGDVDVAFFDQRDLRPERDAEVQADLHARRPEVPWEATNQAAVHLWFEQCFGYRVQPLGSAAEAVATWPETVTSVGIRLLPGDELFVTAPYGLEDLFGMILRRNPRRVTLDEFRRRARDKEILRKWPRVRIIDG